MRVRERMGIDRIEDDALNDDVPLSATLRRVVALGGPARVHKLGVDCDGMREYTNAEEGEPVVVYGSLVAVEQDLEGSVPWCNSCVLATIGDA